jgi:glycosyltransferase involved in cell wall biosynthesis
VISERNTLSVTSRHARRWRARLVPGLARRLYGRADAIVAVSRGVAEDLARLTGLPRERIDVIYNPIVTPALRERAEEPLTHGWFADAEPPVFLAVGRLAPQKDFPALLRAFARVRQQRRARLMILGEGDERPALEELARSLGVEADVALPGFVPNPYPYLRAAAAFVLSSRWEGLPGVLIEALACGTRLVATDCPSGPREILADGRHGRLVPPGDEEALGDAMRAALDEEFPPPPEEACRPFEPDAVVERYLEVLLGPDRQR